MVKSPPMNKLLPIPIPPSTINAPLSVAVVSVRSVILIALFVVAPKSVTVCKLAVDQTVTVPVDLDTAVPVPAVSV